MNKKLRNSLLVACSLLAIGTVAVGNSVKSSGAPAKGPTYDFNYDEPLRAECDEFMTIDGKLTEEAWEDQNYLYWVGGKNNEIKATTFFSSKGLYVGIRAEDYAVKHSGERYYFAQNSRFRIQVVQEDEINYNNNRGNIHPTRQFWFDIDACDTLSRMERQYDAASYVEGEVNGETEYMSAELFMPWYEMGYKAEELNEAGAPEAVKLLIQYWVPSTGYGGFPGFTDDDKFETYYTYNKDGSTCDIERYSQTDTLGYSMNGWTPGDKWAFNEDKTTATNTVNRTQILWFRKDANGVNDSTGTHYVASVKVKAKQVANMWPHVGLMTLSSKTIFSIYGVSTSGLTAGGKTLNVSAARATDGGQWVATKNFSTNYTREMDGNVAKTVTVGDVTVAPDEVYLTVAKRGGELYYFVNGQYVGMEYDERVSGECVIGVFANGQATLSDWSFVDYSDKTAELDNYLRGYVHFLSSQDNGGGYVVIDRLVARHGENVNVKVTPKPGYVLTELKFNDTDMYDEFLTNAQDATYSYAPTEDLHVSAVFKQLPRTSVADIFFELTDRDNSNIKLLGATYTIRGLDSNGNIDNRFVSSGTVNNKGNVVGSLLKAGTHEISEGVNVTITGNYTLEIVCEGYVTETFNFTVGSDVEELENVFSLKGYPYGPMNVNKQAVNSSGYKFLYEENYEDANGVKTFTSTADAGAGTQYMKDSVYNGNFVFNGEVSLMENAKYHPDDPQNIWRCGAVVGYVFATGTNYVQMKTAAWISNRLYINYNGGTELGLDNFPVVNTGSNTGFNKAGASWQFKVARYNGVVYVYNVNGELGFTIDKYGLELVNSKIVEGKAKLDAFNAGMKTMFNAGNEMAIGMYRMKSSEGGGAYAYKFSYTDKTEVIDNQFEAVSITLKDGVNYGLIVESKYQVAGGFLKDSNVTTVFSGIQATEKNYALAVKYENSEERVFGTYDKEQGTYTATFPVKDNAIVWLEEYDFGPITVNGKVSNEMIGVMLTKNEDGTYSNHFNQTGHIMQYYTGKTAKGDFLLDATMEVIEQAPTSGGGAGWAFGSGVGVSLTSGNNTRVNFFTNSWEGTNLLLGVGTTLVKVNGFPRDGGLKAVGNQFNFKIMRADNVLYFFNCNDELIFHLTETGFVVDSATSTLSGTPVAQNLLRETLISMLNAGDEMGVGIYREYVPLSEGAYSWDVDVTTGDTVTDEYQANISLKDGETYTMSVMNGMQLAGAYMKGSPVSLKFTNVPEPVDCTSYILVYSINDKTSYKLGTYDKASGTFTATIPLTGNAEVWLEEYDFAEVSANGQAVNNNTTNLKLTQDANGGWTSAEDNISFRHFYADQVFNGDYAIDGRIITQSTNWETNANGNIWVTGGGFGFTISAGGNNWITFYANAWENGWFIQTPSIGSSPFRVTGSVTMDAMKSQGDKCEFYFVRLNNVIYAYDGNGSLKFTLDVENGITVKNGATIQHTALLDKVNADIKNFFNAGTENAIGIAKFNGAANSFASYTYQINTAGGTQAATDKKALFDSLIVPTEVEINGVTLSSNHAEYWAKNLSGVWTQSTPDQNAKRVVTKMSGDFIATMKIDATNQADVRFFYDATNYLDFMTGNGATGSWFFMATQVGWYSEALMGSTAKDQTLFLNESYSEVGDGYLDIMFVRSQNTFNIYICEYLNNGSAATYDSWKLMFSIDANGTETWGAGFSKWSANNWNNNVAGFKAMLAVQESAIALMARNGVGTYKINVIDDDATVAAFMASDKKVATYAKA